MVVDGEFSDWIDVLSSVIQGSVLGGTLFNLFINDITAMVSAFMRIFADDTKIARQIGGPEDQVLMQDDITKLTQWADKWKMRFNVEKCKVMHCGRSNPKTEYKMGDTILTETTLEKDLGIWFDDSWKPGIQCEAAAKKANAVLGQISRSFHYRKKSSLVPLYKTFVRPHLKFAVAAWSPWTAKDIDTLEKVQKRLVRMLSDVRGDSYEERLSQTGLLTLKERRWRGDMIETFKAMKGINQVEKHDWFDLRDEIGGKSTRSNVLIDNGVEIPRTDIIYRERARLDLRNNFFTARVSREWNRLPEGVKAKKSTNSFKNALDKWKESGGRFEEIHDDGNVQTLTNMDQ